MNVLLVDDEAMMRKILKLTLERCGFRVFDAATVAEALALSQQHPVDILVTDIVLEGVEGWTLAESIREQHPDLPIVFMSGYPIDFEGECKRYSRCTFLFKPLQPQDLTKAISELAGTVTLPAVPPPSTVGK